MVNVDNKYNCCGCTACSNICLHQAITMIPDSLGFLYPKVDEDKCINCGLCDNVCQFQDNYKRYDNFDIPEVYQFRLDSDSELRKSQSGGAFFAIADKFLNDGGVV